MPPGIPLNNSKNESTLIKSDFWTFIDFISIMIDYIFLISDKARTVMMAVIIMDCSDIMQRNANIKPVNNKSVAPAITPWLTLYHAEKNICRIACYLLQHNHKYIAVLTVLFKNNGTFSYIGSEFLSDWALFLAKQHAPWSIGS